MSGMYFRGRDDSAIQPARTEKPAKHFLLEERNDQHTPNAKFSIETAPPVVFALVSIFCVRFRVCKDQGNRRSQQHCIGRGDVVANPDAAATQGGVRFQYNRRAVLAPVRGVIPRGVRLRRMPGAAVKCSDGNAVGAEDPIQCFRRSGCRLEKR